MKYLIQVLEESVKRHGISQPVLLGHLLNIVKMADKMESADKAETAEEAYYLEQELKAIAEEER